MRKENGKIGSPGDTVTDSGITYVMTNYPYTQPMIFNTIKASISKGLVYAAVTIAAFVLFGVSNYLNMFTADIVMVAGMLFICFVVKPKVCRGHVARVGVADKFAITLAGETLGFMWSAFARLPILMVLAMSKGLYDEYGESLFSYGTKTRIIFFLIGLGVFAVAYFTLTKGGESVEENHRRTMAFYKRAIGYKEPRAEVRDVTKTYSYGEIRNNVFGPVKKPVSQPKPRAAVSDEVSVPDMDVVEPQEPEQPRVNRRRRNIDI